MKFVKVNKELKVLLRLHKRAKLLIVKIFKQIDLHYFYNNIVEYRDVGRNQNI